MKAVRCRFSDPATVLPAALVSAMRWNQPSLTWTPTGTVGTMAVAPSAGVNVNVGLGGGAEESPGLSRTMVRSTDSARSSSRSATAWR